MKKQLLSLVAILCLIAMQVVYGQNPTEKFLKAPNYSEGTQIIPVGIDLYDGNEVNTIHYGQTPSNSSNKPVLIFVHGYASNAQVFFKGDDNMYADVYRDGYRSAYVSLTPNDDMWTNGALLANMITRIKSHYNNAPLVLVGWSKGGVDIDAALVHFGAKNQVSEVFTLSTPHFGTAIAELANSVLLSLVNIIFMQNNDATLSLQRGYMNYFRSITDNNPNNTVPYTTIGGWGNGPLNRLDIPQAILHGIDGPRANGGNDGVVAYVSSIRPGAAELFAGQRKYSGFLGIPYYDGPDETNLDHFEVTRGSKVWPYIKSELNNSNRNSLPVANKKYLNPNQIVSSKMQWMTASESDYFIINPNNRKSQLIILSEEDKPIMVFNDQGKYMEVSPTTTQGRNTNEKIYELENLPAGKYQLEHQESVAFIFEEDGPEMLLDFGDQDVLSLKTDGKLDFGLSFTGLQDKRQLKLNAFLVPVSDLSLNRFETQKIDLDIEEDDDQFYFYATKKMDPGIYQLIIQAESPNLKRDLFTSFAIKNAPVDDASSILINEWTMYPNPVKDVVTIKVANSLAETQVTIYTIKGEVIKQMVVPAGTNVLKLPIAEHNSGLYIVEVLQDGHKKSQKLLILE